MLHKNFGGAKPVAVLPTSITVSCIEFDCAAISQLKSLTEWPMSCLTFLIREPSSEVLLGTCLSSFDREDCDHDLCTRPR